MQKSMSPIRKMYFARLIFRVLVLILCVVLYFTASEQFSVLEGFRFFESFTFLHVLWGIWLFDMLLQLLPIGKRVPLGSQKLFKNRFKPILDKINYEALKKYIVSTAKSACKVLVLWVLLIACIGLLYFNDIINKNMLFLISVLFYVCDLICVLIWCPFRLLMKNRCCTTCRIFNWDHIMMFSPLIFICSFYTISLVVISAAVVLLWELCILIYPERFWEHSNAALQCVNCTDKLCTQYCQKLRKK